MTIVACRSHGEPQRDLQGGRPAVKEHDLARPNQCGRNAGNGRLGSRCQGLSRGIVGHGRRAGQRPAMHALNQPHIGKLAQVAADGVRGNIQCVTRVCDHHLSLAP